MAPETRYFSMLKSCTHEYTRYGTSIHFKNKNSQIFAIFLENNLKKKL